MLEIVGRIWLWVLIREGVGAHFHGFVPEEWLAENLGPDSGFLSVPAAVPIGITLYSNATGVVPVVEALLGKEILPGTALALYAAILATAFVLVGWTFNALA